MNNKGFSLVELLAVVTIISIIAIIGVVAYTKNIDYTRKKAYDTMAKSAANAAAEYTMDNLGVTSVTLAELTAEQYLEFPTDPASKGKACTGKVVITYVTNTNALDTEEYDVTICCSTYKAKYHFPGGTKTTATCP